MILQKAHPTRRHRSDSRSVPHRAWCSCPHTGSSEHHHYHRGNQQKAYLKYGLCMRASHGKFRGDLVQLAVCQCVCQARAKKQLRASAHLSRVTGAVRKIRAQYFPLISLWEKTHQSLPNVVLLLFRRKQ